MTAKEMVARTIALLSALESLPPEMEVISASIERWPEDFIGVYQKADLYDLAAKYGEKVRKTEHRFTGKNYDVVFYEMHHNGIKYSTNKPKELDHVPL